MPEPVGAAQVPSPRQKVEELAPVPLSSRVSLHYKLFRASNYLAILLGKKLFLWNEQGSLSKNVESEVLSDYSSPVPSGGEEIRNAN